MRFLNFCSHSHLSWPMKPRNSNDRPQVVCHDCCRTYYYDLRRMKIQEEVKPPRPQRLDDGIESPILD